MQNLIALLLISTLSIVSNKPNAFQPVHIEGVVIEEATNKPLPNAYVYTVKGEEESLTNSNGVFVIKTWRALPVTLTIQHGEKIKKITISSAPKKLTIRL